MDNSILSRAGRAFYNQILQINDAKILRGDVLFNGRVTSKKMSDISRLLVDKHFRRADNFE